MDGKPDMTSKISAATPASSRFRRSRSNYNLPPPTENSEKVHGHGNVPENIIRIGVQRTMAISEKDEKIKELVERNENYRKNLFDMQMAHEKLDQKYLNECSLRDQVQGKVESTCKLVDDVNKSVTSLKGSFEVIQTDKIKLGEYIQGIKAQQDAFQNQCTVLIPTLQEKNNQLQLDLNELRQAYQKDTEISVHTIDVFKRKLDQLSSKIKLDKEHSTSILQKLNDANTQINNLKTELDKAHKDMGSYEDKFKKFLHEIASLKKFHEDEKKKLVLELEESKNKFVVLEKEKKEVQDELNAIEMFYEESLKDNKKLNGELDTFKNEIDDLNQLLKDMKLSNKQLKCNIETLEVKDKQLQENLKNYEAKIKELEENNSELNNTYNKSLIENERINKIVEETEQVLAKLKKTNDNALKDINKLQKQEIYYKDNISNLESTLESLKVKCDGFESDIKRKDSKNEELTCEINTIIIELEKYENKCKSQKQLILELQDKVGNVEVEKIHLMEEIKLKEEQLLELNKSNETTTSDLSQKNNILSEKDKIIAELNENVVKLNEDANSLNVEIENYIKEIEQLKNNNENLSKTTSINENNEKILNDRIVALETTLEELKLEKEEQMNKVQQLEENLKLSCSDLVNIQLEKKEAENNACKEKEKMLCLKEQVTEQENHISTLETSVQSYIKKTKELEKEIKSLKKAHTNSAEIMKKSIDNLEKEKINLEDKLEISSTTISSVNEKIKEAEESIKTLRREKAEKDKVISTLKSEQQDLTATMAGQNSAIEIIMKKQENEHKDMLLEKQEEVENVKKQLEELQKEFEKEKNIFDEKLNKRGRIIQILQHKIDSMAVNRKDQVPVGQQHLQQKKESGQDKNKIEKKTEIIKLSQQTPQLVKRSILKPQSGDRVLSGTQNSQLKSEHVKKIVSTPDTTSDMKKSEQIPESQNRFFMSKQAISDSENVEKKQMQRKIIALGSSQQSQKNAGEDPVPLKGEENVSVERQVFTQDSNRSSLVPSSTPRTHKRVLSQTQPSSGQLLGEIEKKIKVENVSSGTAQPNKKKPSSNATKNPLNKQEMRKIKAKTGVKENASNMIDMLFLKKK